jgi:hypothetical protein
MKSSKTLLSVKALLTIAALLGTVHANAWEPNAAERNAAIQSGDFKPYFTKLSKRLIPAVPETINKVTMGKLIRDRAFMDALIERHFIGKAWGATLTDWSKADPKNKKFLSWLMAQPALMDEVMMSLTPSAGFARTDDSWNIGGILESWKEIYYADKASHSGLYMRLAAACCIRPPGSANRGAGQASQQSSILDRYLHFRKAHSNGELMPSFETLTMWEMTHVVSSSASNDDLAWGREALNSWSPGFRRGEKIIGRASQVWRRGANGVPYHDMSLLMGAGGKCGPRSSFGVFINQAFGIPSTGVGQPAHAAVTFRGTDGNWKMALGRGFNVSKIFDRYKMSGHEFLEKTAERSSGMFHKVEHMRWIAALVEKPESGYLPPNDRRYQNQRGQEIIDVANRLNHLIRGNLDPIGFVKKADKITTLTIFEAPSGEGDGYAARIRGFVYPPKTGEYVFKIAADDYADLFLSSDHDPDNRVMIANVGWYTNPREFTKNAGQTSKPVQLEAGKRYYIEALHTESAGNDCLAVAWSGPGIAEEVIPGQYLSTYTKSRDRGTIYREVWDGSTTKPATAAAVDVVEEAPIKVKRGVIHVEAETFFTIVSAGVENCYTGGKQVQFPAMTAHSMCGYKINVPKTGIYQFTARVATVNWGQQLYVRSFGAMYKPKSARASNVYLNQDYLSASMAIDNDLTTRWAMDFGKEDGWLELDLGTPREISKLIIDERALNYISRHKIEYKVGEEWKTLLEGELMKNYVKSFDPITAQYIRLRTFECHAQTGGPTVREFSVGNVLDGNGYIDIPWAPVTRADEQPGLAGRWQTTAPKDMYLVKGEQTIFVNTQTTASQRSVAFRWFQLTPTSSTSSL